MDLSITKRVARTLLQDLKEEIDEIIEWKIESIKEAERYDKALSQEPTSEMVHVETLRQVMWERDIAIEQLHELGYEWGQKIELCEDAVSREDAIKALQKVACYSAAIRARMIGAIEDLPSVTQKPLECDDAISRKKAINVISARDGKSAQIEALEQLPPVTQKSDEQLYKNGFADGYEQGHNDAEQKSGKWVEIDDEPHEVWECDHCGFVIDGSGCIEPYEYRDTYNYCPNCGAKMESEVRNEVN